MTKSKSLFIIIFICLIIGIISLAALITTSETQNTININKTPERIISLSPSVTEILFELELGNKVVGVTNFCEYPEETKNITKVGGFVDPDFEQIIKLRPDLVIARTEHKAAIEKLSRLKLNILAVNHLSLDGVIESIELVGKACGKPQLALQKRKKLEEQIKLEKAADDKRPSILLCVGRSMGTGSIKDVYVAGQDELYDRMIYIAGGKNACTGMKPLYPKLGPENIQKINPDIIIDLAVGIRKKNIPEASVVNEWNALKHITAVKNKNVFVFTEDYSIIPGPRIFGFISDIKTIIRESKK